MRTNTLALPRGLPLLFHINGLTEKWDSFRSMLFQGFFEQCPTGLPRSGIKPLGSAKVRRLTTTSENESTIDGYAALQAEMVD